MQFFVRPGSELTWYAYWKETRMEWHKKLGIPSDKLRYHDHIKLAHYANAALDIEFEFPFGWKELEGIHSRTDYDLSRHQEFSKKKMQYFDNDLNADGKPYGNYVPYVVETSVGLDRLVLTILSLSYKEEEVPTAEEGKTDTRTYLSIPPAIAPVKLAILPLVKKEGLPEIAKVLTDECRTSFHCQYDEKDSIGKRYRRQDAIGTPFCATIDHQTKEDNMVTIRNRDSLTQERIPIKEVKDYINKRIQF
jgi:glycyl-tRNA synthetase